MKAILKGIPDFVNTPKGLRVGQEVKVLNPVKVHFLSDDDFVFISNGEWAINIPKKYLYILDDDEGIPGSIPEPKKRPIPFEAEGNVFKPPLGLCPKDIWEENIMKDRFHEVCSVIVRYYSSGLKIHIEWVEEYNELIDKVKSRK